MRAIRVIQFFIVYNVFINEEAESKITDEEYNLMPKVFHLDDFDDCMDLGDRALYCNTVLQLAPVDSQNKSQVWTIIQEVIRNPRYYRHDRLRYGICVPLSCPNVEANGSDTSSLKNLISECYSSKFQHMDLKAVVAGLHCETNKPFYTIDEYDVAVAIALTTLIAIVFLATCYEGCARYKPKEEYDRIVNSRVGRLISCFAIAKNWDRLTSRNTDPDLQNMKCLQGIRFYNLLIIIMVHAALCTVASSVQNPQFVEDLTQHVSNSLLVNNLGGIQTFMMIAGFLLSFNFFKMMEKQKRFRLYYIPMTFINRYIRLTPCLLVMTALNGTWLYHLTRGPMWDKAVGLEYRSCRKNWWANILYINNYYDVENMCMIHTWYLAADTQLFLVALFVVALMWKFQKHIKLVLGIVITIGFALPGILNYYYNYDMLIRMYPEPMHAIFANVPQFHHMYTSALVNFGGYALGLAFGYLAYKRRGKKITAKAIYITIWWIFVWTLSFSVIFYGYVIYQEGYEYTRIGAAVYVVVYRIAIALGVSLITYSCIEGVGWLFNATLTWSPLEVLGRVTYCTYLVHVSVVRVRGGQSRSSSYFSHYVMLAQTSGDAVISFIFGTLLTLFVELPVSALQKLMVPQLAEKKNSENQANAAENGSVKEYNQRF